jgi:hypothetical protein
MQPHLARDFPIAPAHNTEFEDFCAEFGFVGILGIGVAREGRRDLKLVCMPSF